MAQDRKKNKDADMDFSIGLPESRERNKNDLRPAKAYAKQVARNRSPERVLRNELLAIQYEMEDYVGSRNTDTYMTLDAFLKRYLKVLNMSLKKFANHIDTSDSNLKKYLTGERRFNIDLALRFGHFFHTEPELWLKIQLKNELDELRRQKKLSNRYKKYDYEKVA